MLTESGLHGGGINRPIWPNNTRANMHLACMRTIAGALCAALLMFGNYPTFAQSADPKAGSQRPPASEGDGQKKIDDIAEAAKVLKGPSGNPECVWLGRHAVRLLWHNDLDTAFRHLDLYDRFGCPSGHIPQAFRCLVRQGDPDPKNAASMWGRVHTCWINPSSEAAAPAPSSAAAPSGTTNR